MIEAKTNRSTPGLPSSRTLIAIFALLILLGLGYYAINAYRVFGSNTLPKGTIISQSTLEAEYGLHLKLVAVTAAGGMVDVRLQFADGAKAKELLQDGKNLPVLWIGDKNVVLKSSQDSQSQAIDFSNGGNLFLLFPNSGNAVQTGTPVTLVFGDIRVEPIQAR